MDKEEGKAMGVSSEAANHSDSSTPSSVSFKLVGLPESMNSIYQIIYAQRRVQMKPDVVRYKVQAKLCMPPWRCDPTWLYGIKIKFIGDWYFKNLNVRKVDLPNLEKVVCDVVSEKYGFDDARIFEKYSWKVQSAREAGVQVSVYRLCGNDLVDTGAGRGMQKEADPK